VNIYLISLILGLVVGVLIHNLLLFSVLLFLLSMSGVLVVRFNPSSLLGFISSLTSGLTPMSLVLCLVLFFIGFLIGVSMRKVKRVLVVLLVVVTSG
jgi:hypothetical protein